MPQIIVVASPTADGEDRAVMLQERVNLSDFESEHFAAALVERIGWAVGDAHEVERAGRAERSAPRGARWLR